MKERIKNDLPMLIGIFVAMIIVDALSDNVLSVKSIFLKIVTTIVLYLFFRFFEFRKKNKYKK